MPATTAPNTQNRPRVWQAAAEVLLMVLVCLLFGGGRPPHVNEPHYLGRLVRHADPSYCPGDLFLDSPDAHAVFVTLLGWMPRVMSLDAMAWSGRLVSWLVLAVALRRLVRTVGDRPWLPVLAMLWLAAAVDWGQLAGEWVIGGFESKTAAYALVLLGLADAALGRWPVVAVWLGAATGLHALVGGWSALVLMGVWLADRSRPTNWRRLAGGIAVGLPLALCGVVPALRLSAGQPSEVTTLASQVYVFERLPHHAALLAMPADWLWQHASRHLLLVLGVVLATWGQQPSLGRPARIATSFAAGALVLSVLGYAIELGGWNRPAAAAGLLRYYWWRLADIAVPVAATMLAATWFVRLPATRLVPRSAVLVSLLVALPLWQAATRVRERVEWPAAPADMKLADGIADWHAMCEWIRARTPADALFLTPREGYTFKWYAARAEVVNHKDIPQNAAGVVEWHRRLHDVHRIGGDPAAPWSSSLGQLGEARVTTLLQQYGADYVLTTRDYPLRLPVVYAAGRFVLYAPPKF